MMLLPKPVTIRQLAQATESSPRLTKVSLAARGVKGPFYLDKPCIEGVLAETYCLSLGYSPSVLTDTR